MVRPLAGLVAIVLLSGGAASGSGESAAATSSAQASNALTADVRAVLDRYVKAVNEADEDGLRDL